MKSYRYRKHLQLLFIRLQKYSVKINPVKCIFGVKQVYFSATWSRSKESNLHQKESQLLENFPNNTPSNIVKKRQILGNIQLLLSFYPERCARPSCSKWPLNGSKTKDKRLIECIKEFEAAFNQCKESLSRATMLAHPQPSAELTLTTDVSDTAMGAVLQ